MSLSRALYLSYHARVQAGDTALRARHYRDAATLYRSARTRQREVLELVDVSERRLLRPEVLENNEALVAIELRRLARALVAARAAVQSDPENPIFLQTLGFAYQELGHLQQAADSYAAALESDPTLFPAANDLGAVLALAGDDEAAAEAFRRAVGANPDYAIAWFNLGVALGRLGGGHALESQGAFGRALRLDGGLADHEREIIFDNDPYFTTLDLSRPLPSQWEFAESQTRAPIAVSALVVVFILLRLGRMVATELVGGKAGERLLGDIRDARLAGCRCCIDASNRGWP